MSTLVEKYRHPQYPNLFEPLRIGNIKLKNRIICAPTSPSMIDLNGHFTPEMIAYLGEKAKGGAAVVTYGEAIVHSATGKSHNKQLCLDVFGVRQGMTQVARAIHNGGAYANIQLSHGGKYGGLSSVGGDVGVGQIAYGPSDELTDKGEVKAMPHAMIYEIIEAYKKGAILCKETGFDMVQIHAAHGWLFSQFLSPTLNKRTDEFGGSLENRARFFLKAIDAVREGVGPHFPIEVRISGDDLTPDGLGMQECIAVAKMIDDKVDLMNVSCGNHEDPDMFCRTHPSAFYPRGVNVYLAEAIRKQVKTPVACVGSLNYPEHMEEILETGQADAVEIARASLADPYLPHKALMGNAEDITPCLRCYECFGATVDLEMAKCAVNPTMGQQLYVEPEIPKQKKTVLIAGGGPAGMEAAIVLAERGHQVTLVEKTAELGGNLKSAGAAYFKKDVIDFMNVLKRRVAVAGVKVLLNTCVDKNYVLSNMPDVLITAIGAKEVVPPIKGMQLPHVVMAVDAEMNPKQLGNKVAIIGGGLVGSESAIGFEREGKQCTIIEMKDSVASEVNSFYRGGLIPEVSRSATCYVNTKVCEIVEKGVLCEKDNEQFLIEADSVVCAVGFKPLTEDVDALTEIVGESYSIGDCNRVGKIYDAMNSAYYTALRI